jgi:hypothetical protein
MPDTALDIFAVVLIGVDTTAVTETAGARRQGGTLVRSAVSALMPDAALDIFAVVLVGVNTTAITETAGTIGIAHGHIKFGLNRRLFGLFG